VQRNQHAGQEAVHSLIAVPIMDRESLVGIVEAVNKNGTLFDDDDLFVFEQFDRYRSNACTNASLLMAERKVEILENAHNVSHEITSTLILTACSKPSSMRRRR